MIIEQISNDKRTKLQQTLQKLTQSFIKRGVSFVITAESEFVGSITIIVTGKLGSVQKTIVIVYNQFTTDWEAFNEGYIYKMISLSEISILIKTKIQKISTLLLKI